MIKIPIKCSYKSGIGGAIDVVGTLMARDYKGIGNNSNAVMIPIGIIDTQGRTKKKVVPKDKCPVLRSQSHGNHPCVVIPVITPERINKRQHGRRFKESGEPSFTITAQDRHGVAIGVDVNHLGVLRKVRTEYGKKIRKEYELGNLKLSRHKFLTIEIRKDNITNTLSSVQKDNYLAEQVKVLSVLSDDKTDKHSPIQVELYKDCNVWCVWYEKEQCYIAIRKLTPREYFRLQGFDDFLFERAEFINSDSQLYKQAGNAVTVNVVYEIAKEMSE